MEESTLRLGGLTPFMLFVRDEMVHKCMDLFRDLYAGKKPMQGNSGMEETIARYTDALAPERWGQVCISIEKSVSACEYVVHFVFGGLLHAKRGERVRFNVTLPQNAITDGL